MGFDRQQNLKRLADGHFDVLVIGGGITGAGVALDATARGLRTALVERHDFSSGTSSKSSKLVHGGLRYLQQGDVRLVYEALAERQTLRKTAPHLVRILPFLLPIFSKDGLISKRLARALGTAMWMYDLTGGIRIGKFHRRIDADEAMRHMPSLRRDRVAGAYLYYDAHADDSRLTLAITRSAADRGAVVANHAAVSSLTKAPDGSVCGATVAADGDEFEVSARAVVNATGVWADDVRSLDEGTHPHSIRPAKGIHISLPLRLVGNDIAVVLPVPKDRRSIFVVPWGDVVYAGTTDTDYDGPVDDPQCTPEDVRYLLGALNAAISEPVSEADVIGTWAGLRPLVAEGGDEKTSDLSRRHAVRTSPNGMVTVTGGKLTTYRRMAADTVDTVCKQLGHRARSRTKRLQLRGAQGWDTSEHDTHLAERYGSDARAVQALIDGDPTLGEPLVTGLPYRRAEAVYAVREEMATTVEDILSRRTRSLLLGREASANASDWVAQMLADELGWSDEERDGQANAFRAIIAAERAASTSSEPAEESA